MKRKLPYLLPLIFMVFVLSGCLPITDEIVEVQHDITTGNFESVFLITTSIEDNNDVQLVTVVIEPLLDNVDIRGSVEMVISLDVTYQDSRALVEYEETFTLSDWNLSHEHQVDGDIENIEVFYVDVVSAEGTFFADQSVSLTEKTYERPEYTFGYKPAGDLVIEDVDSNQALVEDLDMEIADFMDIIDISTDLEMVTYFHTTITGDDINEEIEERVTLKMKADGSYIELESAEEIQVVQYAENRLFLYAYDPNNLKDGHYYINPEVIDEMSDDVIDSSISVEDFEAYEVDYSTMNIYQDGATYVIEAYIKDLMPEEDYELIKELFEELGMDPETIESTIITTTFEITNDSYIITTNMSLEITTPVQMMIDITMEMTLSITAFEEKDFSSDLYILTPPDELNEVVVETDVSSDYVVGKGLRFSDHFYYYTYLPAGQYHIDDPNNNLEFTFYDEMQNEFQYNLLPPARFATGNCAFIPENGYYYIRIDAISSGANDGFMFKLDHLDFDTIYDPDAPQDLVIGENVVTIEGPYDYVPVRMDFSENTVVMMDGTTQNNAYMFYEDSYLSSNYDTTYFGETFVEFLDIPAGTYYFYFSAGEATVITFDLTVINASAYKDNDINTMESISAEEFSDPIFTSETIGRGYLRLDITQSSYVTMVSESCGGMMTPAAHISDSSGYPVDNNGITQWYGVVLEPGAYMIDFYSRDIACGRFKIVIEPYSNVTNQTVTLGYTTVLNPWDDDFPEPIVSSHRDDEHVVNTWFTLEEDSVVYVRSDHFRLFNNQDELLGIYYDQVEYMGTYFHLEAGTYYLQKVNNQVTGPRDYYISMAIVTVDLLDDSYTGNTVPEISFGTYTFTKDNVADSELLKFVLGEDQTITFYFSSSSYVYNEQGDFIWNDWGTVTKDMTAGTYYIFIPNGSYNDVGDSVSIMIQ